MYQDRLIVAYYTANYRAVFESHLLPSLRKLPHVRFLASMVPEHGDWLSNVYQKPYQILNAAVSFPWTHLLYVDADAVLREDPWPYLEPMLDGGCDLAAHKFRKHELLGGTLLFPHSVRRLDILRRWIKHCQEVRASGKLDQAALQRTIDQWPDNSLRVQWLPAELCCIFDLQRKLTPDIRPVIEHFQSSRTMKHGKPDRQHPVPGT